MARQSAFLRVLRELPFFVFGTFLVLFCVLIVILLSPLILLIFIQLKLFPPKPVRFPASEAVETIGRFLEGEGEEEWGWVPWDWDDFISCSTDPVHGDHPALEKIKRRAASVDLPLTIEGRRTLEELLIEAQQLAEREQAASAALVKLLRDAVASKEVPAAQISDAVAFRDLTCKTEQDAWHTLLDWADWIAEPDAHRRDPRYAAKWHRRLAKQLAEIDPQDGGE